MTQNKRKVKDKRKFGDWVSDNIGYIVLCVLIMLMVGSYFYYVDGGFKEDKKLEILKENYFSINLRDCSWRNDISSISSTYCYCEIDGILTYMPDSVCGRKHDTKE